MHERNSNQSGPNGHTRKKLKREQLSRHMDGLLWPMLTVGICFSTLGSHHRLINLVRSNVVIEEETLPELMSSQVICHLNPSIFFYTHISFQLLVFVQTKHLPMTCWTFCISHNTVHIDISYRWLIHLT